MPDLTAAALDALLRQHGVISQRQLSAAGISERSLHRLLHDQVLVRTGRAVYRIADRPTSFEARLVEQCLEHPNGFITGPTLGAIRGLGRMPRMARIHFCVPHPARFAAPNYVHLRQSTLILPEHVEPQVDGMTFASWPRLAFDLAVDLRGDDLASVIEQMLHRDALSVGDLGRVARQLCRRGRPGSTRFAQVLLEHHGGPTSESLVERKVLRGLLRRGIPVEPQVSDLALPNGRKVRIDMAVPAVRWGVEVDVHPAHVHLRGTTRDKQRDRVLHLIDWQVEHVTPLDLLDFEGLLDELVTLYHHRVATLAER